MIEFKITLPDKDGMKNWEINSLIDFMEDLYPDDIKMLLEGGSKIISKGSKVKPLEIIIERSD